MVEKCSPHSTPVRIRNQSASSALTQLQLALEIRLYPPPHSILVRIKFSRRFEGELPVPHAELLFRRDFSGAFPAELLGGLSLDAILVAVPVIISGATLGA